MTAPLVSVITPAFNAALYVDDLCGSIAAQTHRPLELCIVDDGSADNTLGRLRAWQGKLEAVGVAVTILESERQTEKPDKKAGKFSPGHGPGCAKNR